MYDFIVKIGDFLFRAGLGKLVEPWLLAVDKDGYAALRPFGRFGGAYRFADEQRLGFVVHCVVVLLGTYLAGVILTLGIFGWESLLLWTVICALLYRMMITILVAGTDRISVFTGKAEAPVNEVDYMVVLIRRFVGIGWLWFGSMILAISQPNYTALWWVGTIVAIVCSVILLFTMIALSRS